MSDKKNKVIISKYLNGEASEEEIMLLVSWLEDEKNKEVFKSYLIINHALDNTLIFDSLAAYKKTQRKIKKTERKGILRYLNVFEYAAVIAVIISAGYFFLNRDNLEETRDVISNNIAAGSDKAILTLSDGTNVTLDKNQSYASGNAKSNGSELIYSHVSKGKIVYNYLTVPRGGQFCLKLPDQTKVWLNSESKLKFPVDFIQGKTREVELVYGEAYFDVSHSTNYGGSSFKVLNHNQEVEVLGTQFNIKAYRDEQSIYTTLIEGSVEVHRSNYTEKLVPNQQSIINLSHRGIAVSTVDVNKIVSWKKGVFLFENESLKNIMKVLSRWYDIDIVFESKNIEAQTFNGALNKKQSITSILTMIKNTNNINYEIQGKTLIIR
ncbi:FecR family protein [Flavobacterium procerum]|uniref:FecR family protein n=1 Tax=Flavobacterium procerum TaxID=1455569 RepID=A0ABV6BS27_9FLAO